MADKKQFDNNGRISIWQRTRKSDGEIFYSGTVELNGVTYDIIMNNNESDNEKAPKFVGRMTPKK